MIEFREIYFTQSLGRTPSSIPSWISWVTWQTFISWHDSQFWTSISQLWVGWSNCSWMSIPSRHSCGLIDETASNWFSWKKRWTSQATEHRHYLEDAPSLRGTETQSSNLSWIDSALQSAVDWWYLGFSWCSNKTKCVELAQKRIRRKKCNYHVSLLLTSHSYLKICHSYFWWHRWLADLCSLLGQKRDNSMAREV